MINYGIIEYGESHINVLKAISNTENCLFLITSNNERLPKYNKWSPIGFHSRTITILTKNVNTELVKITQMINSNKRSFNISQRP